MGAATVAVTDENFQTEVLDSSGGEVVDMRVGLTSRDDLADRLDKAIG